MLMMLQTLQSNKIAVSSTFLKSYFGLGWSWVDLFQFLKFFSVMKIQINFKELIFHELMIHLFIKIWILETLKSWNIECLMIYWLSSSCSKGTYIIQNHQMPKSLHSTFNQPSFNPTLKSVINYLKIKFKPLPFYWKQNKMKPFSIFA